MTLPISAIIQIFILLREKGWTENLVRLNLAPVLVTFSNFYVRSTTTIGQKHFNIILKWQFDENF